MAALRALLWIASLAMVGLTFAWPALAPASREGFAYQAVAVAALVAFFAALAALLWHKACKAPRT